MMANFWRRPCAESCRLDKIGSFTFGIQWDRLRLARRLVDFDESWTQIGKSLYSTHGGLKTSWVAHVCCLKVDGLCGSPPSRSYIGETERSYRDLSTSVPSRPHIYANIQPTAYTRECALADWRKRIHKGEMKCTWTPRRSTELLCVSTVNRADAHYTIMQLPYIWITLYSWPLAKRLSGRRIFMLGGDKFD